jgi:cytochrome bd-type quinol oxidase subunit 2
MEPTMTPDQVRLLFHEHLVDSIGPFLGALFSGGLVALGVMCMILLSSKGQGRTKQRRITQIYVVLVVTIVLGYQVEALIELNREAFPSFYEPFPELIYALTIVESLLPVVVIALTDGLLVR